ncbi:MBL fold metallo-hydrolase [Leptolyngbya sp. FACHB-261]|uniref:MBL fold metallo-hydrolase n=1 Tax=Leptolyngbya sp. FACHB-261 TaxID=2692806 RepID=UPI001689EDED|nr:MBL fold metallo-hydrolase [Leptolyngbya sp. FACHB-261]MBD2105017.1 MBL fold metallo-hydrolase [Leptolyngbya sp. FACHB-261]
MTSGQVSSGQVSSGQELVLPNQHRTSTLEQGSIFFVGTATVILRYGGFTILTDPNFLHQGDHVHLGYGLKSARVTNPAIEIEELPPLDFVLLSHLHDDHFDRIAEHKLDKDLPIVTTGHSATALKHKGFRLSYALKTWETLTVTKGESLLRITAMPGQHAPGLLSAMLPPVMGSMLEFPTPSGKTAFRLYISGDTLLNNQLREIPKRYSEIDLALLHLGGTRAFGIMLTMDGKQGVEAIKIIAPKTAIPIHFNDYTVFKSPLEDFIEAVKAAGLEQQVKYLAHGETYTFDIPPERSR